MIARLLVRAARARATLAWSAMRERLDGHVRPVGRAPRVRALDAEVRELRMDVVALQAKPAEYGAHHWDCRMRLNQDIRHEPYPCSCEFSMVGRGEQRRA